MKRTKCKTVIVKESIINIMLTNARDLNHKVEDHKNKVKFFKSSIFAVQETNYKQKGMFMF